MQNKLAARRRREKEESLAYVALVKISAIVVTMQLMKEGPLPMTAPGANDRKVSFSVTGPLAKEMFDSMYPDAKEACSDDKGYSERSKGNVTCVLDKGGYTCHFGFNLRAGASISGSTC